MKRYSLIIIILFSSVFYNSNLQSQNNNNSNPGIISGRVIEAETGKPLSYANVMVYSIKNDKLVSGAISDREGAFIVKNLPFGDYYILIKFIGYEKKKVNHINYLVEKWFIMKN